MYTQTLIENRVQQGYLAHTPDLRGPQIYSYFAWKVTSKQECGNLFYEMLTYKS